MYSLFRFVAGSSSLSSFFLDSPNCSSPRKSVLVSADYLRFFFLFPSQRPCVAEPEATCPSSAEPRARRSLIDLFAPLFPSLNLTTTNLSSSAASGPDKVAYPMLRQLFRSALDFLLHVFNLSWFLHSFPSIWKISSIIPTHKVEKPLDSPASF